MRLANQQEESAHRKDGRRRLALTGRKTLYRVLPKWLTDALPQVDKPMLDLQELLRMARLVAELSAQGLLYLDVQALTSCHRCNE